MRNRFLRRAAAFFGFSPSANVPSGQRLDYAASCKRLQEVGQLDEGDIPPVLDRIPRYDDEVLGVEFFRMLVEDAELDNLSLPRTYFGRSEIKNVRFRNSDLTESCLCWNDFIDVDFSSAVLVRCDLRASIYARVNFTAADLSEADMRCADWKHCDFTRARMSGTVLTNAQGRRMRLSSDQRGQIAWTDDDGPEPDGG